MTQLLPLGLAALYLLLVSGTLDISTLFNYENQSIPTYITKDNTTLGNDISDEVATLGRTLFYDKSLSLNNSIACASCHQQSFAFSDVETVSVGQNGGVTGRHSMRLINARFADEDRFFWDERAATLEIQSTQPIQDHIEMGFSGADGQPDLDSLIRKMEEIDYYQQLFPLAFGDNTISETRIQDALAQFIRSIQSFDSKYDEGRSQVNNNNANFPNFTASETRGKNLFMTPPGRNGGAGCNGCHRAPTFDIDPNSGSNGIITVAGDPTAKDFTNTRAPSLRDLVNPAGELNGPMMHDGSKTTLRAVIDHYNQVPATNDNRVDNRVRGRGANLGLSETDKVDLENFLKTLTGVAVYTAEKWSDPFATDGSLLLLDGPCAVDLTISASINNSFYTRSATNSISCNSVLTDATVSYTAGATITLTEGFHAQAGSIFSATIGESCSTDFTAEAVTARTSSEGPVLINPINDVLETAKIEIYPNPFNNEITLDLDSTFDNDVDIQIFNAMGQRVQQLHIKDRITVDVSRLEKGIYFVKAIQSGKILITKKLIKN